MFIHDFATAAMEAVNAHDPDAVARLWAEPAEYASPLTGPQRGLEALRTREAALFAGFGNLQANITALGQEGSTGAMLVRFNGIHDGPYAGLPPSGNSISIVMAAIVTFDGDGRVIAERVILDTADIAAQLTPRA